MKLLSVFRLLSPQYLIWHIGLAFAASVAVPVYFGQGAAGFIAAMQIPKELFTLVVKVLAPMIAFAALYTGILKSLRGGSRKSFFHSVLFYLAMCSAAVAIAFPIGYIASESIDVSGIRLLIEGNITSHAGSMPETSTFENLSQSTILWSVMMAVLFAFVTDAKYREYEHKHNVKHDGKNGTFEEKQSCEAGRQLLAADAFVNFFEWLRPVAIQTLYLLVAVLSPWAIIGALGGVVLKYGVGVVTAYGDIIAIVFTALICQALFLVIVTRVLAKVSPWRVFLASRRTLLMAFSTSSSKAALPLAMEDVEKMGVGRRFVDYQIALGASINMDGTAIYMGIMAFVFSYAWLGYHLDIATMIQLVFACTLFAIGAAGIPSGSLIFLMSIFPMVGVPAAAVFAIQPVDAILDRGRTVLNIWGDVTGAVTRAAMEGELDRSKLTAGKIKV